MKMIKIVKMTGVMKMVTVKVMEIVALFYLLKTRSFKYISYTHL